MQLNPGQGNLRSLLFDLDGTLTDSGPGICRCIRHALLALDLPAEDAEAYRDCVGPPLQHSFRRLIPGATERTIEAAIAHYRERYFEIGMFENALYPGIDAMLEALSESGLQLYVATSKPQVLARRILAHFDLDRRFEAIHGSELDGTRSDKAELLQHLAKRHSLSGGQTRMIGDRAHDVRGAKANGMTAAGVLWGYGSRNELVEAGAEPVLAQPVELLRFTERA